MNARLVLRNVGPVSEAELHLSGVVLLYGPHGAGRATVARAVSVASRLLGRARWRRGGHLAYKPRRRGP
ncbi:MAG: ATP-binding protein [Thermoproteaceae archaeon]|nr:ATP-binding protein [Thermoproteaceae archaeon]